MKTRSNIWLILIVFAAMVLLTLFMTRVKHQMVDFTVNYEAGKRLSYAETLYRAEDEHYMFKYPPAAGLIYLPLTYLPLDWAKGIWFFLIVGSSVLIFRLSYVLARDRKALVAPEALIFPPLILAKYYLREIELGQINAVITALLLLMVALIVHREKSPGNIRPETLAGLLWGMAASLKPYAVIFLPYFIVKGRGRALLSGLAFMVLSAISPSAIYGFRGNLIVFEEWIRTLSQSTPALFTTQDNISFIAFFMKWSGNLEFSYIASASVVALLAFTVLAVIIQGRGKEHPAVLECALLLCLVPLISPLGWDYTLLMSTLGIVILVHDFAAFSKAGRLLLAMIFMVISLSLYDILGRNLYAGFMRWSLLTVCFSILVIYLASLRFKQVR